LKTLDEEIDTMKQQREQANVNFKETFTEFRKPTDYKTHPKFKEREIPITINKLLDSDSSEAKEEDD